MCVRVAERETECVLRVAEREIERVCPERERESVLRVESG